MLDIDIEPRYGILFIRLSGNLNKQNSKSLNSVNKLLKQVGIRNVVFNLQNLETIDEEGTKALSRSCHIGKNNNGTICLCIKDNIAIMKKIKFLLDKMAVAPDELSALKIINV